MLWVCSSLWFWGRLFLEKGRIYSFAESSVVFCLLTIEKVCRQIFFHTWGSIATLIFLTVARQVFLHQITLFDI